MLLIVKEQWLWRWIVTSYQTARLKVIHGTWKPWRATRALKDLTPAHQANAFSELVTSSTTSLVHWRCNRHQLHFRTHQWGTALVEWLSNTEKAKHTTEHGYSLSYKVERTSVAHKDRLLSGLCFNGGEKALRWGDIRLLWRLRWLRRLCYHCLRLRSATRIGLLGWKLG